MPYTRDPSTVVDSSAGGDTVKQAVDQKNNEAINDVINDLNTHANNELGRSHIQIDSDLNTQAEDIEKLKNVALTSIVPVQSGDRDKVLTNDGTTAYWGNFEVRKPTNTLADGATLGTPLELTGTPYRNVYGVDRDYREGRVATDLAMSNIVGTYQEDNDIVVASKDDLAPDTEYYYDLKDVDKDGAESLRSIPTRLVTGEKLSTPYLSMPATAVEGAEVNGAYTIANGTTPIFTIPPEITDFQDLGAGLFKFTAPLVSGATDFIVSLKATQSEKWESDEVQKNISVADVPIQDGPTVIFNDADGWDKTPINGSIEAPATSVGANNTAQIFSASPEILQTSGKLTVLDSSSAVELRTSDKVESGDILFVDGVRVVVNNVTQVPGAAAYPATPYSAELGEAVEIPNHYSNNIAANAFNGLLSPHATVSDNPSGPGDYSVANTRILAWDFKKQVMVPEYSIAIDVVPPTGFNFVGSSDGVNWDIIDTVANPTSQDFTAHINPAPDTLYRFWGVSNIADSGLEYWNIFRLEFKVVPIEFAIDISAVNLTQPPTAAIKQADVIFSIAAGITDQVFVDSDFSLVPDSYSAAIDGDNLKITGAEILLDDNSALKRLAMKVEGANLKFNTGKIYIKERV